MPISSADTQTEKHLHCDQDSPSQTSIGSNLYPYSFVTSIATPSSSLTREMSNHNVFAQSTGSMKTLLNEVTQHSTDGRPTHASTPNCCRCKHPRSCSRPHSRLLNHVDSVGEPCFPPVMESAAMLAQPIEPYQREPRPEALYSRRKSLFNLFKGRRKTRGPELPHYVDSFALLRKMPVIAHGTLHISVHGKPVATQGSLPKGMLHLDGMKRYAQLRGSLVLLQEEQKGPVTGVFSPVGCVVSSMSSVRNLCSFNFHVVTISRNDFSVQLRFKSEAEAEKWTIALHKASMIRQPCLADFSAIAPIGKGADGEVFLVLDNKSGRKCALKRVKKSMGGSANEKGAYFHTINERLGHEEMKDSDIILKLWHSFQTRQCLYLVTEFCEGGDVCNFLDMRGARMSESEARFIMAQVVLGLKELHGKNILLRDLKPENVLLDADGYVKLADLGLCKPLHMSEALTRTTCGTLTYAAPEVLRGNRYGVSCDLWSLGILMYTMLTMTVPRMAATKQEALQNLSKPIVWPTPICEESVSLVKMLTEEEVEKRVGCSAEGIAELWTHPFFKDVDWEGLSNRTIPSFVKDIQPSSECGPLRNFYEEEWQDLRMDSDTDCSGYMEIEFWPLRNLSEHPIPKDFLVGYTYSRDKCSM